MAMAKRRNPSENVKDEAGKYRSDRDDNNFNSNNKNFQLCLQYVPKNMTESDIRDLCLKYAKVDKVKFLNKTSIVFVSFATLNEMEQALTGLKNNDYGINVNLSHFCLKNAPTKRDKDFPNLNKQVETGRRPLLNHEKKFCEFDTRGRQVNSNNTNYAETYTEENIKTQFQNSKDLYNKNLESMTLASELICSGKCTLCGNIASKMCERCQDFYCSLHCQKKDWPKHKHICFPMPALISSNGSVSSRFGNIPNIDNLKIKAKTENMLSDNKQICNGVKSEHEKIPLKESKLNQECTNNKENVNVSNFIRTDDSVKIQNSPEKNTTISSQEYPKNSANPPSQDFAKGPTTTTASHGYLQHHNNTTNANEKSKAIVCVDYPKSGSIVSITAIKKPNFVYIRSLAKEDVINYIKTLSVVNNEAQTSKRLTKMPNRGDFVIADFQGSGYYRALVLNAENEDKISIAYIDFGNTENKKLSELKEFPENVRHFKRHALPINLKDMPDFSPNEKTTKYLYSFVDCDEKDLKLVYESDAYKASELIDMSTNEVLNKKILELQEVKEPKLSDTPVLSEDIISELIPAGKNVPLYVYDDSFLSHGYISCIHEKDIIPLEKFNQQIRAYASKVNEQYCPRATEICLVKYEEDNLWYRAECLEVKGDENPAVMFIDYGNITNVHVSKIRKYPKEFTHPCRTSQCRIAKLPKRMTNEALKRLKELIPLNDKILVKEVEKEESSSINVLYMDEVLERLKEEKLI